MLAEVDPTKGGVKISPMHEGGPFAANDETLPMAEYAIRELNGYGLSHLLLPFIANPDLVERLKTGAPLAEIDWTTVYASGPKVYSDYPTLQLASL
jgi:2,4-dienoyl-CoA reductase-like NADH-dependent reductase (Old Yellow Enzyme family)